jgi:hypothetical protein
MKVSYSNTEAAPDLEGSPTPLRVVDEHTQYIGKLAKPAPLYRALEKEYRALFGVGLSDYSAEMLEWSCHREEVKMQVTLIFVDEPPTKRHGLTWFFLREIGSDASGDLHMMTLDQIILCS